MPKVQDAEVDAALKRLANRAEMTIQDSEDAQENDLELDYLADNLRDELRSVVLGIRSLLQ